MTEKSGLNEKTERFIWIIRGIVLNLQAVSNIKNGQNEYSIRFFIVS
jgi:hypothetical protein